MPSPDGTSEPAAAVSALHCREDLPHPTPCRYAVLFSSRPFLCGRNHTADRSGSSFPGFLQRAHLPQWHDRACRDKKQVILVNRYILQILHHRALSFLSVVFSILFTAPAQTSAYRER